MSGVPTPPIQSPDDIPSINPQRIYSCQFAIDLMVDFLTSHAIPTP
jgi:hypothetical protein